MAMMIEKLLTRKVFWRNLGLIGWAGIIILSVIPSAARPHTGAGGASEHFIAYAMVAFCFATAFGWGARLSGVLLALVVLSGMLELLQLVIPGRTSELVGFVSAAAGAVTGAGVAAVAVGRALKYPL
jgi:VanZ family protein